MFQATEKNQDQQQGFIPTGFEAIVLAGGLGTRLREAVPELPKCMAPVGGRPFLFYVINYLRSQGVEKFIFSLGYKHELIEAYLHEEFATLPFKCVVEAEPLGTGGAIQLACTVAGSNNIIVANGDTLFKADLRAQFAFHSMCGADCTLSLKPMQNFERYGAVELNRDYSIKAFHEKQFVSEGLINGGVYVLNREKFLHEGLPEKFSFEKDYLESLFSERRMYGVVSRGYFIDIGIPADFERAGRELVSPPFDLTSIDKNWSLFLDRDGVINHEKEEDYILNWEEFLFYDDTVAAIRAFSERFGKIFIVSNQRGVGRGRMSEADLQAIHTEMKKEIESAGGRLDRIYYCTEVDALHPNRKPNPGMAFQAKNEFPGIELSKSVMVGNKLSDMRFGRNAGMYTIYLTTTHPEVQVPHPDIDLVFPSLMGFAQVLR